MKTQSVLGALEEQFVGDERDELAVGGFLVGRINFDAEDTIDIFDFASRPSDLDGVAYCAFDLGRRRAVEFCYARVEAFGDGIDDVGRVNRHFDCLTQKLIAFDMRRYAHRDKEVGYLFVKPFRVLCTRLCKFGGGKVVEDFEHSCVVERFGKKIARTVAHCLLHETVACELRHHHHNRFF